MSTILAVLLIFCLRVTDVSIGTVRVLYAVRGQRLIAAMLGIGEAGVFIFALSRIDFSSGWKMLGYALGFAAGNFVGISLEQWIASGSILARIVLRDQSPALTEALRERGFGVTVLQGSGREGEVSLLFVVAARRRGKELLRTVEQIAPEAFLTIEAVHTTRGGYLRPAAGELQGGPPVRADI